MNCGKKSIVLDLKTHDGASLARELALKSDIVLENFKPGVMKRLGLDYESLATDHPRLIYCSVSGFGQSGPLASRAAYAPVIHAFSGYDLAHQEYQGGDSKPPKTGLFIADMLGALNAHGAILTALLHRERSGLGQYIDVALLDGMLYLMAHETQLAQFPQREPRMLYTPLRSLDGYVMVATVTGKNFEQACDAIGRPELKTDPRFTSVKEREKNWSALMEIFEGWSLSRTSQSCEDELLRADVPCSRYRTVKEVMADPHLAQRGTFVPMGAGGDYRVGNTPYKMSRSNPRARQLVAQLGEHTGDVLDDWLGLPRERIAELRDKGVFG
jgi:CoA:oxalate CoA-transferase